MKRCIRVITVSVLSLLAFALLAHAEPAAKRLAPNLFVKVATDRADALYHVGEKATFNVELKPCEQTAQVNEVTYGLSNDGVGDLGKGKLPLKNGKASVTGALGKTGILRCTVYPVGDAKALGVGMAGAAFDPFKIEPTAVMPADFDEFWNAQKAELAKVPMDPKLEPEPQQDAKIEVFRISLANVAGSRVYGYLAKPKGGGPFPAILSVPGAGFTSSGPGGAIGYAAQGFLSLGISVHNIDNSLSPEEYKKRADAELKDYSKQGNTDRTTYYFRRVTLSLVRSVDYLTSRPDWDKKHMIINGSSQGGALTLIGAGVDPRITALAANVPGMCDHSGRNFGRPSGWPQLVPMGPDKKLDPKVLVVSGYYDAVNFARKIKAPSIMGVGLIDGTCPSTTCFAAYNVLPEPKQMDVAPLMGHASSPSYGELKERWIMEQAGLKK